MTNNDKTGRAPLSTAGSRVTLRLVTKDATDQPCPVHPGSAGEPVPATHLKSKSPLVHTMAAYADAIDRQVAALMND